MTKSLEQIQIENRKFILEAIHGCSYEEALKKEMGYNCEVLVRMWGKSPQRYIVDNLICYFDGDYLRFRELVGDISTKDLTEEGLKNLEDYESTKHRIIEVIGKPLTLSRVLLALKDKKIGFSDKDLGAIWKGEYIYDDYIYEWDLTKETLEEQSEETQRGINSYLIINNLTNKN